MLTVNNLSPNFDEFPITKPQSFSLNPGECLLICGANGAGKTSLLKSLIDLNDRGQGGVTLNNHRLEAARVGYIGHRLALFDALTVSENLNYWAQSGETVDTVSKVLSQVGLFAMRDAYVFELSLGQKKRLALARFYLFNKQVWCLDEPFNGLDRDFSLQFALKLQDFLNQSGYLLMTSHQALPIQLTPLKELYL